MRRAKFTPPRDLTFMLNMDLWPRWSVLPIKRSQKQGWPETAMLFADGKPTVYKVNLFSIDDKPGVTWGEKLKDAEKIEYSNFETLVADGWRVD